MNEVVQYKSEENYAIITIANGKANAISHEVVDGLNAGLDNALEENKVVIITGQPGIFSAGFDLKVMTKSPESAKELVTRGSQLSLKMLSFPKPIIIACSGHAIAKGGFLLLSADYRIGIEGDFKIGLNEVMIGMTMHNAGIVIARARLELLMKLLLWIPVQSVTKAVTLTPVPTLKSIYINSLCLYL